ncbi:CaiB/BaiF CoA-transferase family protein [Saccharomonospora sp. NPDC046836]|uniref:CaiB/BaiF CoA transferase family protein n=1 Tax=Saccharomonospora sp. NPDC046836 TaxID=3156921 RepID=UPI0033E991B5
MTTDAGALDGLTVLDLSDARGNYCGKLFAELGADVVLVEPRGGNALRHRGPFANGVSQMDGSLSFIARNNSKRSLGLDIGARQGREVLRELASRADLVIESSMPGTLDAAGIGYRDLAAVNPRLVMVSITPFGQTGPLADLDAPDLVCMALGGLLYLGGYVQGDPMCAPEEQAYAAASVFGAVGGMIATLHAETTGTGQHVDVSIQESVALATENAVQFFDLEGRIRRRTGGTQKQAGMGVFPCRDGFVLVMAAGIGGNRFWPNLLKWLHEEGCADAERLSGPEWSGHGYTDTDEARQVFAEVFEPFAAQRGKQELNDEAQRFRVPLAPVNAPSDVLSSPQLAHRQYFQPLFLGSAAPLRMPGAPYQLSVTPWRCTRRAPGLGEHTDEVLRQAGYGPSQVRALRDAEVVW